VRWAKARSIRPLATVLGRLRHRADPSAGWVGPQAVQEALGLRSEYLAWRVLKALDVDGRGFRCGEEFVAAAQAMMEANPFKKLGFLFRLHDEDGDGFIERDEIERMLHITAAEHGLQLAHSEIDAMAQQVMSVGDRDSSRALGLGEFILLMHGHPPIAERLSEYGVSLLMPGKSAREAKRASAGASLQGWLRNDLVWAIWLGGYALVNLALFAEAFVRYRQIGATIFIQLARGFGQCLNFDCALIALPMLRHTLTAVRRSRLGAIVPVDDAVRFHAIVGEVIFGFGLLHGAAHVGNFVASATSPRTWATATGLAALAVLTVMWACSRDVVRRSQRFELFHFTHIGYVAFVALLLLHAPSYWMWATAPWLGYAGERLFRARRRGVECELLAAEVLPSSVTKLTLARPEGFQYAAGDYAFLSVPALAHFEWHPFTLTSAPEDPDRLTMHVRGVGNWTSALRARAPELTAKRPAVAHLDGPYGSASRDLLQVEHAIAIAGGIGVTPFASVLQSLLLRAQDPDAERPVLRKLHFVWLANDQEAFQWFRELLNALERRDKGRVLDLHVFMTAGRADMAGGLFELARHLLGRRTAGDPVSGLRAPTGLGAPDLDALLERLSRIDRDGKTMLSRPEVFFCGPSSLERVVKQSCKRLGMRMRSERF
jgi:predicted ferric reductase